jgi:hypothetical protein
MECEQYCYKCNTDNCSFIEFADSEGTLDKINNPSHVYKKIEKKNCIENIITYYTENGDWFSITKPYETATMGLRVEGGLIGMVVNYKGTSSVVKKDKELIKFIVSISFDKCKLRLTQYAYFIHNFKPIVFTYCINGIEKSVKF